LPQVVGQTLPPDSRYRTFDSRYPIPEHPLEGTVRILPALPRAGETAPTETAPLDSVERLPATKYGGAAKTKARYRTAATATSILLRTRQPGPDDEQKI